MLETYTRLPSNSPQSTVVLIWWLLWRTTSVESYWNTRNCPEVSSRTWFDSCCTSLWGIWVVGIRRVWIHCLHILDCSIYGVG